MIDKRLYLFVVVALLYTLVGCSQPSETSEEVAAPVQIAQAASSTPVPPTNTPLPTIAPTDVPDPTALPELAPAEVASDRIVRITVASANLRSGPGLAYSNIGVVLFNDAFEVLAEDEPGLWYKIQLTDGTEGWVAASVTEDVSSEVFKALVSTPAPEDAVEPEQPEDEPEVEEEETVEAQASTSEGSTTSGTAALPPSDDAVAIQIDTSLTGVYREANLSSGAIDYVHRNEIYLVNGVNERGDWVLITLIDGRQGWIRTSRAIVLGLDEVASLTTGFEQEQAGPLALSDEGEVAAAQSTAGSVAAQVSGRPAASVSQAAVESSGTGSSSSAGLANAGTGSVASTSSNGVIGTIVGGDNNIGRAPLRPGSPLYYDDNYSGYGIRTALAPSGPSGLIGSGVVPRKPDVSGAWQDGDKYAADVPRIMLLGDQFTAGTTPVANGYRFPLYEILTDRGFAFDFVGSTTSHSYPNTFDTDHEGHVYYRADQILAGAMQWTTYAAPDYVIMMVGINDVLQGESAESTGNDIQLLINTVRYLNPNVKVLLSHLPYTTDPVINREIDLVNLQMNRVAYSSNTGNSPIYIISQWDIDPVEDTIDGIHPNWNGAYKMALHFYYGLDHFWLVQNKVNGQ